MLAAAGTEDVPSDCAAGNSQVVTKRSREYTKSNYSYIVGMSPDSPKWKQIPTMRNVALVLL